ncbi:hypothetical protein ACETK8_05585 [Brevundimonas staleyi]|uniref:Uncharacterized protein n=1 Tax=Brevundimonas staleyi TaxID=74326 RepID=A0ABW0FLH1_9CAUL
MIASFALTLLLSAGVGAQDQTQPEPTSGYEADVRCMAVLNIAQGMLRSTDPRRDEVAAVVPAMTARIETYLSGGAHDESQVVMDLQAAVNAHRPTYDAELAGCVAHAAALADDAEAAPEA